MINIIVVGDFVPKSTVAEQIEKGEYSFLDEIKPFINDADYSIVNFESPVVMQHGNPIKKEGPNLCCSENAMKCIAKTGFNCVTLANNHFRDFGQVGVADTIKSCEIYDVDYVGGGLNLDEARRILFKQINGKRVAIINVCENEWSIAMSDRGGSAPLNIAENYYAICEARKKADYVIMITHGGIEHYQYPTPKMVETYRFFINAGADAVINHHQHCINGYEIYKDKPIFYGIGNFCFSWGQNDNRPETWRYGFIVKLKLSEDISFELVPFKQELNQLTIQRDGVFGDEMKKLNSVIESPTRLQAYYDTLVLKRENIIKASLLPSFLRNRLFSALSRRGLLGKLYKGDQLYALKNRFSCESHLEVLQRLFSLKTK